jgi:hypothetical protein
MPGGENGCAILKKGNEDKEMRDPSRFGERSSHEILQKCRARHRRRRRMQKASLSRGFC